MFPIHPRPEGCVVHVKPLVLARVLKCQLFPLWGSSCELTEPGTFLGQNTRL